MVPDADRHKKIAVGTAVIAHAALAAEAEGLSVIYTCGDIDCHGLCNHDPALTFTAFAGLFYNLARSAAGIAGTGALHRTEKAVLLNTDSTRALTGGAGLCFAACRRARAAARAADLFTPVLDFLLAAECRFLKGYGDAVLKVAAAHGGIGARG